MPQAETIVVGITETSRSVWRITYNGRILGDSRGYDKHRCYVEALQAVERSNNYRYPQGHHVIDPNITL